MKLVKRALELAVILFALYAFASVPLDSKTGLEHVQAILGTPEAQLAGSELRQATERMLLDLTDFQPRTLRGTPELPTFGKVFEVTPSLVTDTPRRVGPFETME